MQSQIYHFKIHILGEHESVLLIDNFKYDIL